MSPVNFPLTSYDWATSANQGTTLERISEGSSHYGSEANMPTWPQRIPLASLAQMAFRQFLILASPPSSPLSAYVYAVLGVPPTQTGSMIPVRICCILVHGRFIQIAIMGHDSQRHFLCGATGSSSR